MNDPVVNHRISLAGRLGADLKLKLMLAVGLNLWIYIPYHFLQRHQFFPATVVAPLWLDRLIPFSDRAVWLYLSVYLLNPIGPFLMVRRSQIIRYAFGVVMIGAVADLVFLFHPTRCLRPAAPEAIALYRTLTEIDNTFAACPSLHAAFAIYNVLCAGRVLREMKMDAFWRGLLWFWAGLILLATLLTKQHVTLDLAAGAALACGVYFCVFRNWWGTSNKTFVPASVRVEMKRPESIIS